MADDIGWEIEHIPDEDSVYMGVRKDFPRNTVLQPGVFREHNSGMPVDWDKYSTPQETRSRAKNPLVNAVIEMNVGKVRRVQELDVIHQPTLANRAHSEVIGLSKESETFTEKRTLLLGISTIVLSL